MAASFRAVGPYDRSAAEVYVPILDSLAAEALAAAG